jgi:hypothetical protein
MSRAPTAYGRFPARRRVAVLLAAALLPLAGCVRMPDSGPVVETGSDAGLDDQPGIYIDPKPPQPGALPADVVSGFLDAMTATPIQTSSAQEFLTREAQAAWDPEGRTITYDEATQPRGTTLVRVRLRGAEHLDVRGSYRGALPSDRRVLELPMEREDGEWRIARAPNALIVPESWFEQTFRQVSVYFFDPTARILVPEPVFVPLGEQSATAMVASLLRGPGRRLSGVSRTFIPPGLEFGVSVPVNEEGVAQLDLEGNVGQLSAQASELVVAQLAWTLQQDPEIEALRLTIGGQQVALPGGRTLIDVDDGAVYDPTGLQSSPLLFGLRDGLLVSGPPEALTAVDGPMGTTPQGVRSVAVDLDATRVAAVSTAGDRVLTSAVRGAGERVEQVASGAADLLPPAWDFADRLWMVDSAAAGATVSYLSSRGPRELRVPGITGRRVSRFLVSRDGSRLVAVLPRPQGDLIYVSRIRRDANGRITGATPADRIAWEGESGLRITDIAWSSPTSLAVLHRVARELFQVRALTVDGAPAGADDLLTTLPGQGRGLVGSPVPTESLYVVTASTLYDPRGRTPSPRLDPAVTYLAYVG